jgi:pyrimidine-specific ribonucleoside hydrolase
MPIALLFFIASLAMASSQVQVWIDTDPSVAPGGHEIDDGIALLQAFASPEMKIRGVSIVFGNADLPTASKIGREIVGKFGPSRLAVYDGASSASELGKETAASRALARELKKRRLTILILGPATNVATVLKNHPELAGRINGMIAVAGRRPGQRFAAGPSQKVPFRDFNFELDSAAFQVLLDSGAPLTLAPWEISSKVWLKEPEMRSAASEGMRWMLPSVLDWLSFWKLQFGADGFNPFDALAVGAVVDRKDLVCESMTAKIESLASDTSVGNKPYFLVRPGTGITYCHDVKPGFKDDLLRRLGMAEPQIRR